MYSPPALSSTSLAPLLPLSPASNLCTINGLGDSIIGGQSIYSLYNSATYQAQLAVIPAWATGRAVVVGNLCKSDTYPRVYRCSVAGTTGASAPTGTGSSISDGGATWTYVPTYSVNKGGNSMLHWAEAFAGDNLVYDQTVGYGGISYTLLKVIVVAGGTGYVSGDTLTFNNGASGTLTVAGGAITGVTLTNPGYSLTSSFTLAINTSTGSGAVLSPVQAGSGTFGVSGCMTADMVARLPDVLASGTGIVLVHGGTNDASNGVSAATTIANLQTCYETLMAAGKKVVATPILPRAFAMTATVETTIQRVNDWIRDYCRGVKTANPKGYTQIALADPSGLMTDGTNGIYYPIGGTGSVANAVTQDGLHPSPRGAIYFGYCIAEAVKRWLGSVPTYRSRAYSADNGYDPALNPGGNMLEGYAWAINTVVVLGSQRTANGNVYRCTTAGTTASSGTGPSGTGTAIADNTAKWDYMWPAKCSVLGSGTGGTLNTATGVTISGTLATGFQLVRSSGSASGTVTAAVESPWSNGQAGQRQSLIFSLGSGTTTERWDLAFPAKTIAQFNILASDLGVTQYTAEIELEVSGVAALTRLQFGFQDATGYVVMAGNPTSGAGTELLTSNDPLTWPNSGKMRLPIGPFIIPSDATNWNMTVTIGFNASGAAGSATATIKINSLKMAKYGLY
jgi:lysophospholipase L1-like esterase